MTVSTSRPRVGQAVSAPAMSVVSCRSQLGCEAQADAWYQEVERTVAGFSGYLGTEVLRSGGARQDRTVVHRFSSIAQLETWLGSDVRGALLEQTATLLVSPPKQQILVGESDREAVAVVRSYRPAPDDERAFLAWHQRTTAAQRAFPGFRGSEVLRPVAGAQQAWTVVYRFGSTPQLEHWLASAEHERLEDEGPRPLATPLPRTSAWRPLRGRGRR